MMWTEKKEGKRGLKGGGVEKEDICYGSSQKYVPN